MGSCNGLLCFNLLCGMTLMLQTFIWNPATGAFRFMSEYDVAAGDVSDETPPEFKFTSYICGFGFGYDSSVDDYKIVRLVQCANHESFVRVDLLTVGSNKLRRFQLPIRGSFWSEVGVLLHGSLHWLMCRRGSEYYILRFNLETEKLDELIVQIPHPSHKEEAYHTSTISCV
uniref:F-box associated beta-propeller type 1 domain-containing protein n=1 Tax=Kalanchoe fedtschenkoi TaxID=63787 RepID=A0A7N0VGK5_KALFE